MAIKLSGMVSGLDTDSMITELVSAYSKKKDNIYKNQKSLEYKQDAWKSMNTKIYSFFSGKLSSLRFSGNYSKKSTQVSSSKATVTAGTNVVNGTQSLKIKQLAKSGYLTGAKLDGTVKADSKMSDFGVSGSTRINVSINGKNDYIDVDENTSVNQFANMLKNKGLNASFDAGNQRFFISSKESGAKADFSLSGNDANGTALLKKLGIYSVSAKDVTSMKNFAANVEGDASYISNLAKNEYLDSVLASMAKDITDVNTEKSGKVSANFAKVKEYNSEISFAKGNDEAKEKALKKVSDSIDDLNEKITEKQEALGNETDEAKKQSIQKEIDKLNETLTSATEQFDKYNEIKDRVGSSGDADFGEKVKAFETETKEAITALEDENKALNDEIKANNTLISEINSKKKLSIEEKQDYIGAAGFDYSSSEFNNIKEKYEAKYETAKDVVADYERYEELSKLGETASESEKTELDSLKTKLGLDSSSLGATRITGSDAVIELNGAEFTSTSNNFSINGLTITANTVTDDDEEITITTANDVDGIYNMVKDFFKEYNELMKGMEEAYNAASAGDYKPLTEEEENEMTDKQIEKWENKLTTAALRKDSTLSTVVSAMKNAMTKAYTVGDKSYNLSSFGIKTLSYFNAADNEKGLYHIDGDADDSAVSGNVDKLRAAIAEDPDTFVSFFSQLTSGVYKELNSKMASSSMSSAYTVYNDKQMTKQYNEYKKDISNWDKKIDKIREKYEKQFAAMEKALSSLNSQQSSLASMLGQ